MVKNRNWQNRVEKADARRKEAKQRKQQSEEKKMFKAMAQEMLSVLDQNMDSIRRSRSASRPTISTNVTEKYQRSSSSMSTTSVSSAEEDSSSWELHIWIDTLPSECPSLIDIVGPAQDASKSSQRARSASLTSIEESYRLDNSNNSHNGGKSGRKGRGRSGSLQLDNQGWSGSLADGYGKGSNKRLHPRSKESDHTTSLQDSKFIAPLLCKSQFFSGKCLDPQNGGKRGGCRCVHYNNQHFKTLAAIMTSKEKSDRGEISDVHNSLSKAEHCCKESTNQETGLPMPGAIDMMYYLRVPIPHNAGEISEVTSDSFDGEEITTKEASLITDLITRKFSNNACSIASMVYMVLSSPRRDVLLYDRNRNGLVITDFASDVLHTKPSKDSQNNEPVDCLAEHLPITILEQILAFVEAPAVASASQVCKSWHQEIGHASPHLWQQLLGQRSWPCKTFINDNAHFDSSTTIYDEETSQMVAQSLREDFIKHYSVLRDMKAVQAALSGLLTKKPCNEDEMTYQAFSARRGAPQAPNSCVAVEIWGPNQVLAAYSNDCTLRLFQAVPRNGSQNEKFCRELVCQTVDPYKNTKRKSCFIEAMGLDEDVVGCLCSVYDETSHCKTLHILVILGRDDLTVVNFSNDTAARVSEPEEGALQVINIEEAVLNFVLCSLDHVDLRLGDFLAVGGEAAEIELIVSQSMAACGYGRFMVEVSISIPLEAVDDDTDDPDSEGEMLLLDRKLFLFSSSVGAIVWMGDSNPPNEPLRPRLEDLTIVKLRQALPGSNGARSCCTVAAVSHALAPFVMCVEIDHCGNVDGNHVLGSSEWAQSERIVDDGWTERMDGRRPIVVTATDIVVGDTLTRQLEQNNSNREYKSIVTFYSRFPALVDPEKSIWKLEIGDNCSIDRMVEVRDEYILLLCRFFSEAGSAAELERVSRVFALTIHVPSRSVIESLCLYEDFGWNKLTLSVCDGTLACGVWLKGLIMTGSDIREVNNATRRLYSSLMSPKSPKKKFSSGKRRKSRGSGKKEKDGFTRGMNLRG